LQKAKDPADLPLNLLVALMAADKWRPAERFALEWLAKNPGDGAVVYNLAEGYLKYKDYKSAERFFLRALALDPDYVKALNNLAWVMVQLGKPGAFAYSAHAARLAPTHPAILDTHAMALAAENQLDQALQVQRKAVEMAPSAPELRLNLARLALKAGDKALARKELQQTLVLDSRGQHKQEAEKLLAGL
jgi:cellulose synthase operon protein C